MKLFYKFPKRLQQGFSLIELSLALVVIASITTVALVKFTSDKKLQSQQQAMNDLVKIKRAINEYYKASGTTDDVNLTPGTQRHYPCPADPTLISRNLVSGNAAPDYGISKVTPQGNCDYTNMRVNYMNIPTTGSKEYMMCKSATYNFAIPDAFSIIGAPPCKTLGLPFDCMNSPEGHRYAYAVVPHFARSPVPENIRLQCEKYYYYNYNTAPNVYPAGTPTDGPLAYDPTTSPNARSLMYDARGTIFVEGPDVNVAYVLVYFGPDGIGAFPNDGSENLSATTIVPQDANGVSSQRQPVKVGSVYINDNQYQEINHDLHRPYDSIFFSPSQPVTPTDPTMKYEDIVLYGGTTISYDRNNVPTFPHAFDGSKDPAVSPGCASAITSVTTLKPLLKEENALGAYYQYYTSNCGAAAPTTTTAQKGESSSYSSALSTDNLCAIKRIKIYNASGNSVITVPGILNRYDYELRCAAPTYTPLPANSQKVFACQTLLGAQCLTKTLAKCDNPTTGYTIPCWIDE